MAPNDYGRNSSRDQIYKEGRFEVFESILDQNFKMAQFKRKNTIGPFWNLCAYLAKWTISATAILGHFEVPTVIEKYHLVTYKKVD